MERFSLSSVWPCWCPIHSQKALIFYHDMKIMCFEKESYMLLLLLLPYIETEIQDMYSIIPKCNHELTTYTQF